MAAPELVLVGAARRLLWREFEDGHLVFDRDSGTTQLLSPLTHFIWQEVQMGGARQLPELIARVLAEEPDGDLQACQAEVGEAVTALLRAGLLLNRAAHAGPAAV